MICVCAVGLIRPVKHQYILNMVVDRFSENLNTFGRPEKKGTKANQGTRVGWPLTKPKILNPDVVMILSWLRRWTGQLSFGSIFYFYFFLITVLIFDLIV